MYLWWWSIPRDVERPCSKYGHSLSGIRALPREEMMNWPPERKNTTDLAATLVCERPQKEGFGQPRPYLNHFEKITKPSPRRHYRRTRHFITIDYNSNTMPQFDLRNKDIQVWVGDGLVHRDAAKVMYSTVRYKAATLFGKECAYTSTAYCPTNTSIA